MSQPRIRILQISDWHLGGSIAPRRFGLSKEQASIRRSELRASVERFVQLAQRNSIDAILMPGDLFDRESVEDEVVSLLIDALRRLAPVPVCIAPGNHDYLSSSSPYAPHVRTARSLPDWPENVIIFTEPDFTTRFLPELPHVNVTAFAFSHQAPTYEHRLAERIERDPAPIQLLMLHGSRTQFQGECAEKITLPFTSAELLRQGFSYTALGHYHAFSKIDDAQGMTRAAYGGRPFQAEWVPAGSDHEGGALLLEITPDGAESLTKHSLDERHIREIVVPAEEVSTPEALARETLAVLDEQAIPETTLVRIRPRGTCTHDFTRSLPLPEGRVFAHCVLWDELRPAYNMPALLANASSENAPVESLYARELYTRIQEATDPEQKAILQDAFDYGMRAIQHGDIRIQPPAPQEAAL